MVTKMKWANTHAYPHPCISFRISAYLSKLKWEFNEALTFTIYSLFRYLPLYFIFLILAELFHNVSPNLNFENPELAH